MVSNDLNGKSDIFIRNLAASTTTRIGSAAEYLKYGGNFGAFGNFTNTPRPYSISADGRHVAFASAASNLVHSDTNRFNDVFVRDRLTGINARVSVSSAAAPANNDSFDPSISGDGRYVAFTSEASNFGFGFRDNVYVHDRLIGLTSAASISSSGVLANGDSRPSLVGTTVSSSLSPVEMVPMPSLWSEPGH